MLENPSQGIRKYHINDVYTPSDSNSRRERMTFDFVITDAQLAAYKETHPAPADYDIIDVILSVDGGEGPALTELIDRPISIYIDAQTTENDVFAVGPNGRARDVLTPRMMAAWGSGYGGGVVEHCYSRYPYATRGRYVHGGIALHSTPDTCVTIKADLSTAANWPGVFRIGVCKVEGVLNTYARPGYTDSGAGLTVMYEKCLSGRITWEDTDSSTRPKDNTEPGAVCAPWMSPAVDCEIGITDKLGRKYGIYNRIRQAYTLGADPSIMATTSASLTKLGFVSAGGSIDSGDAYYMFEGGGKRLTVKYDDSLVWSESGGSGSGSGHVVVADTNLAGVYIDASGNTVRKDFGSVSPGTDMPFKGVGALYGNGLEPISKFYPDSVYGADDPFFDGAYPSGGSFPSVPRAFDTKGSSVIDIYTWATIIDETDSSSDTSQIYWNSRGQQVLKYGLSVGTVEITRPFTILADSLEEGKVYELNVHYVQCTGNTGNAHPWYFPSAKIDAKVENGRAKTDRLAFVEDSSGNSGKPQNFYVQFKRTKSDSSSPEHMTIARWSLPSDPAVSSGTRFGIIMHFPVSNGAADHGNMPEEIGYGRAMFFKYNDVVYLLTY